MAVQPGSIPIDEVFDSKINFNGNSSARSVLRERRSTIALDVREAAQDEFSRPAQDGARTTFSKRIPLPTLSTEDRGYKSGTSDFLIIRRATASFACTRPTRLS